MTSPRLVAALVALSTVYSSVAAFSFSYTSPVQCGDMTVTWTGGTAPFYLLIIPFFSTPQNITIPSSAFNGTHGSYTTTLRITGKQNQGRFLLTMSDATGVGTGGTSGVLTAASGSGCNTTDPGTAFTYSLDHSLQQCQPYVWSSYADAVQPVIITGLIPLGKTFVLKPPQGDSYTWTNNVATGTNVVFLMVDAQGRQGGSTDLYTVSASDDSSCINSDSPGSTAQASTSTASSTTTSATSTPTTSPSNSSNSNSAAVIGSSIAGGAVILFAIALLVWFLLQRRQKRRQGEENDSIQGINAAKPYSRSADLLPDNQSGQSRAGAGVHYPLPPPHTGDPLNHDRDRIVYDPDPYVLPPPSSDAHSYFPRNIIDGASIHQSNHGDPRHTRVMSTVTSSASGMTKAQMAAASTSGSMRSHGPQRFILHIDAGELDNDEIVELPPMYTQVQPRTSPPWNTAPTTDAGTSGSDIVDHPLRP